MHLLDQSIILAYLVFVVIAGVMLSRRASKNMDSYFLGGKRVPWYLLGISNASSMFDISGTMWIVAVFAIVSVIGLLTYAMTLMSITLIYVLHGGLHSVVMTDLIQLTLLSHIADHWIHLPQQSIARDAEGSCPRWLA